MSTHVLDSWAVLRLLEDRAPTAKRVADLLEDDQAIMSWINLGEVYYVTRGQHGEREADDVVRDLRSSLVLDPPSPARVLAAAALKAQHRMAYADAFAAATAIAHDAVLLTGDPELLVPGAPWRTEDLRYE